MSFLVPVSPECELMPLSLKGKHFSPGVSDSIVGVSPSSTTKDTGQASGNALTV